MTYPVKYMPVRLPDRIDVFDIIDTSYEGQGKIVLTVYSEMMAFRLAKYLNESEGFVYEP